MSAIAQETTRILLVEDNPGDERLIREMLREPGAAPFEVSSIGRLERALDQLQPDRVDLVLLDLGLPDSQGLRTFMRLQESAPGLPVVVISGFDDQDIAVQAVRAGAQDYLVKGQIEAPLLGRVIRHAIERKKTQQMLVETAARLQGLMDHASDGIMILSGDGLIVDINSSMAGILGLRPSDAVGRQIEHLAPWGLEEGQGEEFFRVMRTGHGLLRGVRLRRSDRKVALVDFSLSRVEVLGDSLVLCIGRDVTQERSLEDQLRQSQKMEAVGRLASGVAHDFNNLLTAMFGYADLLENEIPSAPTPLEYLDEMRKTFTQAAGLAKQLLAFSRKQLLQPVVLSPNQLLDEMQSLLHRTIGEDIDLRFILPEGVGNVRTDPGQLQQVVMNMAVNARDAMPAGGMLTIETANAELDDGFRERDQEVVPGDYVMLAVSDSGTGMDQDTLSRIFEPFFTTKQPGQGTGLGLSTVYGIIKQSGGYIWVYSEVGRGTTFKIYLPLEECPTESAAGVGRPAQLAGTETILLAEDDPTLRRLVRSSLERHGYTVLESASAAQALEAAEGYEHPIHLILADVIMPGGGTRRMTEALGKTRPDARVLYMSGFTDDAIGRHGILEHGLSFLSKPFTPSALCRKVREVLDG